MFFNEKDMFCINILNKQKDRIKKVQTTGVVELDDFKQDLKIINEILITGKNQELHKYYLLSVSMEAQHCNKSLLGVLYACIAP